jgi:predicted molibdopterin-dependent oxidoreductase YjgC
MIVDRLLVAVRSGKNGEEKMLSCQRCEKKKREHMFRLVNGYRRTTCKDCERALKAAARREAEILRGERMRQRVAGGKTAPSQATHCQKCGRHGVQVDSCRLGTRILRLCRFCQMHDDRDG